MPLPLKLTQESRERLHNQRIKSVGEDFVLLEDGTHLQLAQWAVHQVNESTEKIKKPFVNPQQTPRNISRATLHLDDKTDRDPDFYSPKSNNHA